MAEENNGKLTMACLRTRLESGSDFTVLSSLYIVTSLLLRPFKQGLIRSLRSGFRYPFILHLFRSIIILVQFLHIIWITEFMTPISGHKSAFLFPCAICRITQTFPLTLKTFLLFMIAAILSHYQSAVHCRSRNVEGS